MREILLYFSVLHNGDWDKIYASIEVKDEIDKKEMERLSLALDGSYITIFDDEYPESLKEITKPPFVIYYDGDINLLKKNKKLWPFGSYFSKSTVEEMNKQNGNLTYVTGYSTEFGYWLSTKTNNKMIIVKDGGIDSSLIFSFSDAKEVIKNGGLIISEYPGHVIPCHNNWKKSNRIKIGLVEGIFLINSAKEKITFECISETLTEGKEVFCYNKNIDNQSHNDTLISKGAISVANTEDI